MADLSFSHQKILQVEDTDLYPRLSRLILSFAVLGYTDVASRLLSKLNQYDRFHGQYYLRALWLLWDYLDAWPEGEKKRVYDQIKEKKGRGQEDAVTEEEVKTEIKSVAQEYAKRWDCRMYPDSVYKRWSSQESSAVENREIIELSLRKEKMEDSKFGVSMLLFSALVASLDVALELRSSASASASASASTPTDGQDETTATPEDIIAVIAKLLYVGKGSVDRSIHFLTECQRAWPLLATHALRDALNLDTAQLSTFAKDVEVIFNERLTTGRRPPDESTINHLLHRMELNTMTNPDNEYNDFYQPTNLFHTPATPDQIEQKCQDLGIQLPDDYKEFLRLTDGFGSAFSGVLSEPGLHPVNAIRWLGDDEVYFTELGLEILPSVELCSFMGEYGDFVRDYDVVVGKAIEIGTEDIYSTWLIPPPTLAKFKDVVRRVLAGEIAVNGDPEDVKSRIRKDLQRFAGREEAFWDLEWCCVTWACGSTACMVGYPSFKAYLGSVAEKGEWFGDDLVQMRESWWAIEFKREGV
ncbi:hypothetical protein P280DRAFT_520772 [Massarina eburnea CBS 473.64]|uniref:Knr4/Smi1-like domain-containing protein n=1 Tax=Massarina eburnea CBS 473.64 TaxID=1395130 RepID=A0A6A6RTT0_9PLEO|nr:hypothetical protein P280DRAFT_520772 [Massarina eburnea CBS 473.64]